MGDGNVYVNIMLEDFKRDLEKGYEVMEEIF